MVEKKKMSTGKKILIGIGILFAFAVINAIEDDPKGDGVNVKSCNYKKVEIKAYKYGSDKLLQEKVIDDCFELKIIDKSSGMVQIANETESIKLVYYLPSTPSVLEHLDIFLNTEEPTRWRKNKGHDIFLLEKGNQLTFVFSDKKKVKSSIKFIK